MFTYKWLQFALNNYTASLSKSNTDGFLLNVDVLCSSILIMFPKSKIRPKALHNVKRKAFKL